MAQLLTAEKEKTKKLRIIGIKLDELAASSLRLSIAGLF